MYRPTARILPKETKIPIPSFAKNHRRKRKAWNKASGKGDKEHMHKMDALNLELSETFKDGQLKKALQEGKNHQIIEKGRLLDSLDLNTGFDAMQKAKQDSEELISHYNIAKLNNNSKKKPKNYQEIKPKVEVKVSDLRDSLDDDDWDKFNDRESPQKPKEEIKEEREFQSDDSELDRDEQDDTDWLRHSMQESMSNWKKEIKELDSKIHKPKRVKQPEKKIEEPIKINPKQPTKNTSNKKRIDFIAALDDDEDLKKLQNKVKVPVSQTKSVHNPVKPKAGKQGKEFQDFTPKQIPIDEYYQMLNQRLGQEDANDKVTFGENNKNEFSWEEVKDQFIPSVNNTNDKNTKNNCSAGEDEKRSSMTNNFMEKQEDASLFSKFKKNKDSIPSLNKCQDSGSQARKKNLSNERRRAREAAKRLAEEKKGLSYEEERKHAKNKKAKMDKIKNMYTKVSRSRSRKRSKSNGPKSCITNINQNPAQSEIQVRPNIPRPKRKIIRDNRTEMSSGPLRQGKFRRLSPDTTTKCTREEDWNIDQFLMDDLAYINKEEAKLQREILIDHKNSINKVKAVEMKHGIDTKMVNTRQMVKQLNNVDPYETMKQFDFKNETEEQIEESLENLNYLLAQNDKNEADKKQAYQKMAEKMNIRFDSTSPVRQVRANKPKSNKDNVNPFAYNAQNQKKKDEYEMPNFKPRSVIDGNGDKISSVTKPKSVATAITNHKPNPQLLNKNRACKGTYLNAENLEVRVEF